MRSKQAEDIRYYNSLDPHAGALGLGWSHDYELFLTELADGSVLIKQGNGDRKLYAATGDGYLPPSGDYSVLTKNTDNRGGPQISDSVVRWIAAH